MRGVPVASGRVGLELVCRSSGAPDPALVVSVLVGGVQQDTPAFFKAVMEGIRANFRFA